MEWAYIYKQEDLDELVRIFQQWTASWNTFSLRDDGYDLDDKFPYKVVYCLTESNGYPVIYFDKLSMETK